MFFKHDLGIYENENGGDNTEQRMLKSPIAKFLLVNAMHFRVMMRQLSCVYKHLVVCGKLVFMSAVKIVFPKQFLDHSYHGYVSLVAPLDILFRQIRMRLFTPATVVLFNLNEHKLQSFHPADDTVRKWYRMNRSYIEMLLQKPYLKNPPHCHYTLLQMLNAKDPNIKNASLSSSVGMQQCEVTLMEASNLMHALQLNAQQLHVRFGNRLMKTCVWQLEQTFFVILQQRIAASKTQKTNLLERRHSYPLSTKQLEKRTMNKLYSLQKFTNNQLVELTLDFQNPLASTASILSEEMANTLKYIGSALYEHVPCLKVLRIQVRLNCSTAEPADLFSSVEEIRNIFMPRVVYEDTDFRWYVPFSEHDRIDLKWESYMTIKNAPDATRRPMPFVHLELHAYDVTQRFGPTITKIRPPCSFFTDASTSTAFERWSYFLVANNSAFADPFDGAPPNSLNGSASIFGAQLHQQSAWKDDKTGDWFKRASSAVSFDSVSRAWPHSLAPPLMSTVVSNGGKPSSIGIKTGLKNAHLSFPVAHMDFFCHSQTMGDYNESKNNYWQYYSLMKEFN